MRDAIADLVRDGDTVAIEGFTHLIGFAAGHEIIRQRRRDLTLARLTPGPHLRPDDRRRGGLEARVLLARQPGRRRPRRDPPPHRGRHPGPAAGDRGVQPLRDGRALHGRRDEPAVLPAALVLRDRPAGRQPADPADPSPYGDETIYAVPPLKPDVAIVHAQRASAGGDTQVWGLLGCQKEAAFAADRVIVVVEELVDEAVIRADPNRTIIPGLIVDAVVVEPWGAHPSYVQGAYDRDNRFYLDWDPITRDEERSRPGCASGSTTSTAAPPTSRSSARRGARCAERARRRRARSTTGRTDERPRDDPRRGPYRSGTGGDPARIAPTSRR